MTERPRLPVHWSGHLGAGPAPVLRPRRDAPTRANAAVAAGFIPLAVAALGVAICPGCSGKAEQTYTLRALADHSFVGTTDLVEERGELHRAVYEMLLARPDLPFGFGGHEGPQRARNRQQAAAVADKANELLRTRGRLHLLGGGGAIIITISRRSRSVAVAWAADRGEESQSFFVDLSHVEGAFNPRAELDVLQVERAVVFRRGEQ